MNEIVKNGVETAGSRFIVGPDGRALRGGPFPRSWGKPPDDREEVRTWITRNIEQGKERLDRGEEVEGQKPKTGKQLLAYLRRRRESPVFGNHARMLLLDLLKRGPE